MPTQQRFIDFDLIVIHTFNPSYLDLSDKGSGGSGGISSVLTLSI
jgi:hypothetical protein